jgi:hypothetical protein
MLDIAITGMGCRFPGGVRTPGDYWAFLIGKGMASSKFPQTGGASSCSTIPIRRHRVGCTLAGADS